MLQHILIPLLPRGAPDPAAIDQVLGAHEPTEIATKDGAPECDAAGSVEMPLHRASSPQACQPSRRRAFPKLDQKAKVFIKPLAGLPVPKVVGVTLLYGVEHALPHSTASLQCTDKR
jgi:hypothetical protein